MGYTDQAHLSSGRMKYVSAGAKEQFGLSALMIRPDGIVAWVSEGGADCGELEKVAARWFAPNDL
ncbi:aromatic-ring hydroxylase C-terminal domain-containing protein [Mucilaginibacter pankratovii]